MAALADKPPKLPLATLNNGHRDVFMRAVGDAQIVVDGFPISDVARDVCNVYFCQGHPVFDDHKGLGLGMLEPARGLLSGSDARALQMDSQAAKGSTTLQPGVLDNGRGEKAGDPATCELSLQLQWGK
ncbi:uncharacterized protein THITE_2086706 [Thermothielavioides terrestris NRRL 8126]|uniref:Uncharacterized protein n=1 Tax=Thermothielavioides terrestris (strain ATCC 38088 / NRRL 8126) TaxID=578455 RepID=G2R4I6_THETT|nr:uncharacterized protein THITE_2086706 [Thermothielavioides terrestris NRRL 8126]AEO65221.1 hypothetical protein THITE_2086706 [Thermothielavioides terrestris NRRL 8126]